MVRKIVPTASHKRDKPPESINVAMMDRRRAIMHVPKRNFIVFKFFIFIAFLDFQI
jgi:hypothetical protein